MSIGPFDILVLEEIPGGRNRPAPRQVVRALSASCRQQHPCAPLRITPICPEFVVNGPKLISNAYDIWSINYEFGADGGDATPAAASRALHPGVEREFFIDNVLVRIHWILEMIAVERPCAMGV